MSTLFDSDNPRIAAAQAQVLVSVAGATRHAAIVARTDQKVLARAVQDQHDEREAAEREARVRAAAVELSSGEYAPMTAQEAAAA